MATPFERAPGDDRPAPAASGPDPTPDTSGTPACRDHSEMLGLQRAADLLAYGVAEMTDLQASTAGMLETAAAAGAQRIAQNAAVVKTEALTQAHQAERLALHFAKAVGDALTATDHPPLPPHQAAEHSARFKFKEQQATARRALAAYELASAASDLALASARAAVVFELAMVATATAARKLTDAVAQPPPATAMQG